MANAKLANQQQLDAVAQQIIDNKVCLELAKTAKQLVFGAGNPDAEIVFIGEAPGKSEDEQGKPFVGAAGKFLNEMLEMIGLNREDIYITNIVKYRPPNNRDPLPDEKKAFLPYLQAQLEIIQPKIVATLGRHSMNCFLPDLQISKIHGKPKRIKIAYGKYFQGRAGGGGPGVVPGTAGKQDCLTLVVLPLFHPAAALYNGGMRQTLIDDFAQIPTIVQKLQTTN